MTSSYIDEIPVPEKEYILNESREIVLCTRAVSDYDESLPSFEIPKGHEPISIREWFEGVLEGIEDILVFGSVPLSEYQDLMCDNCRKSIDQEESYRVCPIDEFVICEECATVIREPVCRIRTPKESDSEYMIKRIDELNQEERERYNTLLPKMRECFVSHTLQTRRPIRRCKVCDGTTGVISGGWRVLSWIGGGDGYLCGSCYVSLLMITTREGSVCLTCERGGKRECKVFRRGSYYTYGICEACEDDIHSMDVSFHISINETPGSIMEWIPLFRDEYYHTLFYNVSKSSPRYHKLGVLSIDDHGRSGMHFFNDTLENFIREINLLQERYEKQAPKGWEAHYLAPLCKYVQLRGKSVHFG